MIYPSGDPVFESRDVAAAAVAAARTNNIKELVMLSSGVSRGRIYRRSVAQTIRQPSFGAARLQCCTEGLGSESSDVSEDQSSDAVFCFRQHNISRQVETEHASSPVTAHPAVSQRPRNLEFPPPLTSLSWNADEKKHFVLKSHRHNGRFMLTEVSLPPVSAPPFRILRQDGRLQLKLSPASLEEEDSSKPEEVCINSDVVPTKLGVTPAILVETPAILVDITNHLDTKSKKTDFANLEETPVNLAKVSSSLDMRTQKDDSAKLVEIPATLVDKPDNLVEVFSCLDSRLLKPVSAKLEDIPTRLVTLSKDLDTRLQLTGSTKLEMNDAKLEEVTTKPEETTAKLAEVSGDLDSRLQRTTSGNIQQQLVQPNCSSSCSKLRRGRGPNYFDLHRHRFVTT